MQIFADASPEKPVHLACECGERITLVAPPEDWPPICPACGSEVRAVDPSTVGRTRPGPESSGSTLLTGASGAEVPASRAAGVPARRGHDGLPVYEQEPAFVEFTARGLTGKPVVERVAVRPPEVFGRETLMLAFWLAAILTAAIGHRIATGGDFTQESMFVNGLLFAVVTIGFVAFQRYSVGPTLGAPRSPGFFFTVAFAGIPVSVGFVLLYFAVISEAVEIRGSDSLTELMQEPGTSVPLMILTVGVIPGVFEELGFRGWMQSIWRMIVPARRALLLTACAFTVAHFSLWGIGWLLPMGIYLGWLRESSGSIWPGVIAHLGHNTAIVVLARFA